MDDELEKMRAMNGLSAQVAQMEAGMGDRQALYKLHEIIMQFGTPEDFKQSKNALKGIAQEILARI